MDAIRKRALSIEERDTLYVANNILNQCKCTIKASELYESDLTYPLISALDSKDFTFFKYNCSPEIIKAIQESMEFLDYHTLLEDFNYCLSL